MRKLLILIFGISAATAAVADEETTDVNYGQSSGSITLNLIWKFDRRTYNDQTCAVITGVRNSGGSTVTGDIAVPETISVTNTTGEIQAFIVKGIAANAFKNQLGITSISISRYIEDIGTPFCSGCSALSSISVDGNNPWFTSDNGLLFNRDYTRLIACPATTAAVTLPSSLITVDEKSFANCLRLSSISFPASVSTIGDHAFTGCTLLESLTFKGDAPAADTSICDNPGDVTIYKEKTSTGWDVEPWTSFKEVKNITSEPSSAILSAQYGNLTWKYRVRDDGAELYNNGDSVIPTGTSQTYTYDAESKTWIGDGTLNIPSSLDGLPVTRIGVRAFIGCSALISVTVPSSTKIIDDYAFENCSGIEELALPKSLTELGTAPFYGTWIASLNLPAKVSTLHGNPVAGCEYLDQLTVDSKNRNFTAVDNVLYNSKQTRLYGAQTYIKAITIPASVSWIATNAFSSCSLLTNVTYECNAPVLDDKGLSLYADVDPDLVSYTAAGTTGWDGTTTTNMPKDAKWPLVGPNRRAIKSLFQGGGDTPTPGDGTYTDKYGTVWTYRITDDHNATITKAEQATVGIANVPESINNAPVVKLGGDLGIFSDSDKLIGVSIASSVTNIGSWAFHMNDSLSFVNFPKGSQLKIIENSAFSSCEAIETLEIPNTCESIGDNAFSGCSALVEVVLPGKLTELGSSAFSSCTLLQSIDMPTNLAYIAYGTFSGCSALKSVVLPKDVVNIAPYAFYMCSSIKSITIPKSVTALGSFSFRGCSSLTEVTFEGGIPSGLKNSHILDYVTNVNCPEPLYNTYKNWLAENGYTCTVNNIEAPEQELKSDGTWYYHVVDGYAELWCTNGAGDHVCALVNPQTLGALTLPETLGGYIVKGIGNGALSNLRGITSVTVPDTYEWIGNAAFSNDTSLASISLGSGIRYIGHWPCYGTAITSLAIPDSVTAIDGNPGAGASMLRQITTSDDQPYFTAIDGLLYDSDIETLLACPATKSEISLPVTVTAIAEDAFYGCHLLSGGSDVRGDVTWSYETDGASATVTAVDGATGIVTIPATLGGLPVTTLDSAALNDCTGVTEFVSLSTAFTVRGKCLYSADGTTLVRVPDTFVFPYTAETIVSNYTETATTVIEVTAGGGQTTPVSVVTKTAVTNNSPAQVSTVSVKGNASFADVLRDVVIVRDYAFYGCNRYDAYASEPTIVGNPLMYLDGPTKIGNTDRSTTVVKTTYSSTTTNCTTELVLTESVRKVEPNALKGSGITYDGELPQVTINDYPYEIELAALNATAAAELAEREFLPLDSPYPEIVDDAEYRSYFAISATPVSGKSGFYDVAALLDATAIEFAKSEAQMNAKIGDVAAGKTDRVTMNVKPGLYYAIYSCTTPDGDYNLVDARLATDTELELLMTRPSLESGYFRLETSVTNPQ